MKNLLYIAIILFLFSCGEIHEANVVRETSYELSKDSLYDSASVQYKLALDSLQLKDDFLRFNEASNRYHLKDTTVKQLYLDLLNDSTFTNDSLKNKINQQLALLDIEKLNLNNISAKELASLQLDKKLLESAIHHTENALRADYKNKQARKNLELLYAIEDTEEKKEDQDQNKDQQNKDQNKDQKDQQNKDQKGDDKDKQNQNQDQKQDGGDQKDQNKKGDNQEDKKGKDGKEQNKDQPGKDGQKNDPNKKGDQKDQQKQSGGDQKDKKEEQEKEGQPSSLKDQQEQQKAEQQKLINQRLQEQGLSKEQMDQLLRSLNEQNKKYIQQIRKEPNQNNSDDGKPDW